LNRQARQARQEKQDENLAADERRYTPMNRKPQGQTTVSLLKIPNLLSRMR